MLLLLNSEYGARKKSLNLNWSLANVWASRHTKCNNVCNRYTHALSFRTVKIKIVPIHIRLRDDTVAKDNFYF